MKYHFCFADSNVIFSFPAIGGIGNFKLLNNSIITLIKNVRKETIPFTFNIDEISDKTLRISLKNGSKWDTINFKKMHSLSNDSSFQIEKVTIRSFPCYGKCPVFNFEINSNGKCYYQGIESVDSIGYFEGQMTKRSLEILQSKADYIKFSELKKYYSAGGSDNWTTYLVFHLRNKINNIEKQQVVSVYGPAHIPFGLELFIKNLFYLQTKVLLTRSIQPHDFEYAPGDKKLMDNLLKMYN
jgi:hypothetical protein